MGRKARIARGARKAAMRSHPAGKGCGDDLVFPPVPSPERMDRRPSGVMLRFDMAAIARRPVIDPFARKEARGDA
ncbi:hypothetical protein [Bifidobacterium animalis]|uniref:hypothetical protein n=1 Tax=Bifidobacterium animalis TaxID=28025 RepID=UPI00080CAE52|nr:hypothetical protein [Bifidobacterium animalis]ANU43225.1 hypothetical protein A4U98_01050 [Bifidobacterium animalis subsp. animalis]PHQ53828.1 hypothetical protein ADH71_006305 [Bifidobacterium animalis subsp. animalis]QQQ90871.1 hypothetical protein I5Q88_03410 [Bifidobacterium animalis]UQE62624.1 hypothetical protein M2855_04225 [Bifidobacterium animalis]